MAQIMMRHAQDDFTALQIAQGMENAGANVFSIVSNGQYIVWAKIESDDQINAIDEAIEKEMGG